MIFNYLGGLVKGLFDNAGRSGRLPGIPRIAVKQITLSLLAHMGKGMGVGNEFTSRSYILDNIESKLLITNRNSLDNPLDHSEHLIVHDGLGIIPGHAAVEHPQAINEVDTCQRR